MPEKVDFCSRMENFIALSSYLSLPRNLVILSHRNPDGDAIGSSLALYHWLNHFGHSVRVIFPSEFPLNFNWLPGSETIQIFDLQAEQVRATLEWADAYFCLDFNSLDRIDKMGEVLNSTKKPIVMIDHHLDPEPFATYQFSDHHASSTCELIYDFIRLFPSPIYLTRDIASCIYTGVITDTGSFKYSFRPVLFRKVADLLETGIDAVQIQSLVFDAATEKQLRLLGHCLINRMEILPEYKTGIIYLTKEDYAHFEIQRGDTEGIVNYLLKLENVKMAAFISEQPSIIKISLRSKGNFSVERIAKEYFNGGGHFNASGGSAYASLSAILQKLKSILPRYQAELLST